METKEKIIRLVNAFENDSGSPETEYDKIYLYHDGTNDIKQVTLARGYTECGGTLWKVFEYYQRAGGKNADQLLSYKKNSCKGMLSQNKDFLNLIIKSAKEEQEFRDAENQAFDELYWAGGVKYFNAGAFKENLSLAVIQDSFLHSGGMLKFLVNAFPEHKPSSGGDEERWIAGYVDARFKWLANHKSQLLRNTVYRPRFFLGEIKKGNWNFDCPLIGNGAKIC